MEDCRDTTIDAFNEYVMGFRRSEKVDARLSLTTFDSESIDLVEHLKGAVEFPELSRKTYVPRASTPLLDAIGHAVAETDKVELRPGEKVGLVILTDGYENRSREHTKESIKALLDGREKDKGWLITFLGAEMDAFTQAGAIGLSRGKAMYLDKKRMLQAMRATAASQERYASTGDINHADFTAEERQQSTE
jgi:hypothetical protein